MWYIRCVTTRTPEITSIYALSPLSVPGNHNDTPHWTPVSLNSNIKTDVNILVLSLGWLEPSITSTSVLLPKTYDISFLSCVSDTFLKIHAFRSLLRCSYRFYSNLLGCWYMDPTSIIKVSYVLCIKFSTPQFSLVIPPDQHSYKISWYVAGYCVGREFII